MTRSSERRLLRDNGLFASVVLFLVWPAPIAWAEADAAWSTAYPSIVADLQAGKPFVTVVLVPLCSNSQIDCGSKVAGNPGSLATNLYWGAVFGARRHFDRKQSGWERVDVETPATSADGTLERAVYRRRPRGSAWGLRKDVEQIVVLEAVHGDRIDRAVDRFWSIATSGARVRFRDGGRVREERVHVTGYAGHNRLMDNKKLPPAPESSSGATPSFVMACYSESYFASSLRAAGSSPLVLTRALMAPEGYVVDAMTRALGDNLSHAAVRDSVVREYAKWQRLSFGTASSMFSRPETRR